MSAAQIAGRYTLGEEIANSVTHGVGLALSIAGLAILATLASLRGDPWAIVGASIFGTTLVLLYLSSTLYHAIPYPRSKRVLRVLDHSAIYLLIAGTYTPFTLVTLRGALGWVLFGLVWGLAVLGIITTSAAMDRLKVLSIVLYVAMGWLVAIAAKPLIASLSWGGLSLIIGGGVVYTSGLLFYAWRRLPYHHTIWHIFVLVGSLLHFLAVLFYVVLD
jgi:hemolysin III